MKFAPSADPAHVVRARRTLPQSEKSPAHPLSEEWPTPRPSNENRERRPIRRRTSRTLARYSVVFLIGITATLAVQSYGEKAMEMVRAEAPSLAWLLPVSTAKPPEAASSPQLVQQLEAGLAQQQQLGLDFAVVRRSLEQLTGKVEQLAAQQDQMTKTIETLQAVEQEISQRLSSRAVAPRKPPQPTAQSSAAQSPVSLAPPPIEQPSR
jgi:hypothetical protein